MPELTPENPTPERAPPARDQGRITTALAKIAERALTASPDELVAYKPRELDLQICEAMLSGCMSFRDIAESIGCSSQLVSRTMRDPLVCGWVSRHLDHQVNQRLGLVGVAMLNRALNGNVPAAKLLLERYGKMINRTAVMHMNAGVDYAKLTDDDLAAFISDAQRQGKISGSKQEDSSPPSAG